ncbi:MAG: hypothetical protein ACPGTQ_07040 [Colwellia sp.]
MTDNACLTNLKNLNHLSFQSGMALVTSLIFLTALMGIASMLLLNSVIELKIAGANQEKIAALAEATGELDTLLLKGLLSNQPYANTSVNSNASVNTHNTQPTHKLNDCPASINGYSNNLMQCVVIYKEVTKNYGKQGSSSLNLHSALSKQVLARRLLIK